MKTYNTRYLLPAAGLLLAAAAQAQFFATSSENRLLLALRNGTDSINVGFDIGPVTDFESTDPAHALPGVTKAALETAFGSLSGLKWTVGGFDQLGTTVPAKTDLWMTSDATVLTYAGGQNSTRTKIGGAIGNSTAPGTGFKNTQYGSAVGTNGRKISKPTDALQLTTWNNSSYSASMDGPGTSKWDNTSPYAVEDTVPTTPGSEVSMPLWYLPGNVNSGIAAEELGSIVFRVNSGGDLQALFVPVPEPASVAFAAVFALGALGLVRRNRASQIES